MHILDFPARFFYTVRNSVKKEIVVLIFLSLTFSHVMLLLLALKITKHLVNNFGSKINGREHMMAYKLDSYKIVLSLGGWEYFIFKIILVFSLS